MSVVVKYRDIPLDLQKNIVAFNATNWHQLLSQLSLTRLKTYDVTDIHYSTVEQNLWKLDGSYVSIPETDTKKILFWSTVVSADTAVAENQYEFSSYPSLIRIWNEFYTSPGIRFTFADPDYCSHLRINWFRDELLIETQDFYPDAKEYFCRNEVNLFNKIEVIFYSMSKPNRFLKLLDLFDGRTIDFTLEDIESLNVLEEIRIVPSDDSIPINTFDLSLLQNTDTDMDYIFQNRQNVDLYFNDELYGTFFIDNDNERTGKYKYHISAIDYKGILDTAIYYGGQYNNITAQELIDDILLNEPIPYIIDDVTAAQTLTGILKIQTKREALSKVLSACSSVCDDSRGDKLRIFKLDTSKTATRDENSVFIGTNKLKQIPSVTAVNVTAHEYSTESSQSDMFKGYLPVGTHMIQFEDSIDASATVTVSGATLVSKHTNYCVVTVSTAATVTISAYKLKDSPVIYRAENNLVRNGTPTNEKSLSNNTLISQDNVVNVLANMLQYYQSGASFSAKMLIEGQMVGDYLTATTDWLGTKTGFVEKMEYTLRTKQIGTVTQQTNG